jgi:Cdc6-like AAA superfamily ATPase
MAESSIEKTITEALHDAEKPTAKYDKLQLPGNPFPIASISSPDFAYGFGPLREEHMDVILSFLRSTIAKGRFSGLRIVGDYGFGKTHILRWLEDAINKSPGGRLAAVYVQNPGASSRELIYEITRAMGEESLRKRIWYLVLKKFQSKAGAKDQGSGFLKGLMKTGQLSLLFEDTREEDPSVLFSEVLIINYRDFLRKFAELDLDFQKLYQFGQQVIGAATGNVEMATRFMEFAIRVEEEGGQPWIRLIDSKTRSTPFVPQREHLRAILRILRENGISHLYVLLDEFEDVALLTLTPKKRKEYVTSLRSLIEENLTSGFSMALAITNPGWKQMTRDYPGIKDRFNFRINLSPLRSQEIEELIRRYLKAVRKETHFEPLDDLYPFSRSAIGIIRKSSKGNPRTIISICHDLVEFALSLGPGQSIDGKLAANFLTGKSYS